MNARQMAQSAINRVWGRAEADEAAERRSAVRFGSALMNADEIKMDAEERAFWGHVRNRGALWYLVNKGLAFLILYPAIGHWIMGWNWEPRLLVEGWLIGLVAGAFVWMRKELRYRFTLEEEGLPLPDAGDE